MKNYRMCALSQGAQRTMGWIEDRGAKVGASVEIKELGGFWTVTSVGETSLTQQQLREKQSRDRNAFASIT